MKNIRKAFMGLVLTYCIAWMALLPVKAEENAGGAATELNQVMTISADCEAKETPDEDAAKVFDYTAGDSVWVVGETQDGWYKVSFQGKEGYVLKEYVTDLHIETEEGLQELPTDELNEEMEALEAEGKMVIEEVERQREEKKRSRVWAIVISALVIAILAVGIFSARKSNKKGK